MDYEDDFKRCNICDKPIPNRYEYCYDCNDLLNKGETIPINVRSYGLYNVRDYSEETSDLDTDIRNFKKDPSLAKKLGQYLISTLEEKYPSYIDVDIIVPVPTSNSEKGYNHSYLLCQIISDQFGVPICDILQRDPHYNPQHLNPPEQRYSGMKGKISCNKKIDGLRVLIIDDTIISGGTIFECSRVLVYNGAKSVKGLVVGRGTNPSQIEYCKNYE